LFNGRFELFHAMAARAMMTRIADMCRVAAVSLVLSAAAVLAAGCGLFSHPGETASDVHNRHIRHFRVNQKQMMADVDEVLLIDEPTGLHELRLP
jgi:hypothetical protein